MKTATRQHEDPLDALASLPDGEPAIDAWLAVLSRLMHLPECTRSEICLELREHLRERVRDLLLSGCDERSAVRTAIDELGETAQLARRLEAANTPLNRRLLMHAIVMLVGGGALAAGIIAINPNKGELNVARFGEAMIVQEAPKSLADARITLAGESGMRDAVEATVSQAGIGLLVDWGAMEQAGIDFTAPMGLTCNELPGPRALTLIAQTGGNGLTALSWRVREGGMIEFGLRHDLDAREIELLTYDITATINIIAGTFTDSKEEAAMQITSLLSELVTPEYWRDNGGDLAQMKLVGGRLFVEAPSRTHTKVKWILDQLPNVRGEDAQAAADGQGAPLLSDIRLLGQFYSTSSSDAEF